MTCVVAPVVAGRVDWSQRRPVVEDAETWRRRALLYQRRLRASAGTPAEVGQLQAEVDRLRGANRQLRELHRSKTSTAALALQRLLRHPAISHEPVERVRAYLAGERRQL